MFLHGGPVLTHSPSTTSAVAKVPGKAWRLPTKSWLDNLPLVGLVLNPSPSSAERRHESAGESLAVAVPHLG